MNEKHAILITCHLSGPVINIYIPTVLLGNPELE